MPRNVIEERAKHSWNINHWPENDAYKKRNELKLKPKSKALQSSFATGRYSELGPY